MLSILFCLLSIFSFTVQASSVIDTHVVPISFVICCGAAYQFNRNFRKFDHYHLNQWLNNNQMTHDDKNMFFRDVIFDDTLVTKVDSIENGIKKFVDYYKTIFMQVREDIKIVKNSCNEFLNDFEKLNDVSLFNDREKFLNNFDDIIAKKNKLQNEVIDLLNFGDDKINSVELFNFFYIEYPVIIKNLEEHDDLKKTIEIFRRNFFLDTIKENNHGEDFFILCDATNKFINISREFLNESNCNICYELSNSTQGNKCGSSFICNDCVVKMYANTKNDTIVCPFCRSINFETCKKIDFHSNENDFHNQKINITAFIGRSIGKFINIQMNNLNKLSEFFFALFLVGILISIARSRYRIFKDIDT